VPALLGAFAAAALKHARWADVIHANWLGAGIAGAPAHLAGRKPLVLTLRGDDAYNIHAGGLWRVTGRFVFSQCAAVTAVSENMSSLVQPYLPPRCGPVIVPTFGVDTGRFRPPDAAERAARGGGAGGLFVGNILRAKGVDVLLRALAACRGDWETFHFVGAGPDTEAMGALARRLDLGDRVEWAGRQPGREVAAWMRSADFLVLPSLSEGRPNVVLEAMASGLAVVASRVGGVPHLIDDGRTGLIVEPGDVAGLAAAIARVGRDADLRSALGRQARRHIEDNDLTWDRTAEEFEVIFRRVTRR